MYFYFIFYFPPNRFEPIFLERNPSFSRETLAFGAQRDFFPTPSLRDENVTAKINELEIVKNANIRAKKKKKNRAIILSM